MGKGVNMQHRIILTEAEIKLAKYLGSAIYRARSQDNSQDHQRSATSNGEVIQQLGVMGELAACRFYNVYPDLSVCKNRAQQKNHDFMLPSGIRVDVKYMKMPGGDLLVTKNEKKDGIDVFIMVAGDEPSGFEIKGWAKRSQVEKCPTVDFGKGVSYRFPAYALRAADELR